MSGSVPFVRAAVLTHRLLLRQLVTRGRIIALLALGGVLILAALGVAASAEIDDQVEAMVGVIDGLGLVLVVPVVALVFASASLGDGREDGTLVYLWLRPMDRLPVVIGAFFASITVSLPLTVVPMAIAAAVGGSGSDGIIATVVASGVGVLGYSALFVLFGLLVKNAIIWGLAYVLLWEGLFTQFSSAIGRVSVRGYLRAIVDNMAGVRLNGALDISTPIAVIVCLGIVVAGLLLGAHRLQRMEID